MRTYTRPRTMLRQIIMPAMIVVASSWLHATVNAEPTTSPPVIDFADRPTAPSSPPTDSDYWTRAWLIGRTTSCAGASDVTWCRINTAKFRDEAAMALRGDYGAIRNVSFCLQTGCDGAVIPSRVTGCAWRLLALGHPKTDSTDRSSWIAFCTGKKLTEQETLAATMQAMTIYRAIHGVSATLTQVKRWIPHS